jgi:hypothetical protein
MRFVICDCPPNDERQSPLLTSTRNVHTTCNGTKCVSLFVIALQTVRLSRHLSPVRARRARPAFCCTHGGPRGRSCNSFLCGSVKACFYIYIYIIYIYIKVTSKHTRIRLRRCVQIATPSAPYFRSFTAPKTTRSNWQLHFYIYRYVEEYSCYLKNSILQFDMSCNEKASKS